MQYEKGNIVEDLLGKTACDNIHINNICNHEQFQDEVETRDSICNDDQVQVEVEALENINRVQMKRGTLRRLRKLVSRKTTGQS